MPIRFRKYSALGNEYWVLLSSDNSIRLGAVEVKHVCDQANGPGADGVLVGGENGSMSTVVFWNADGSVAEKSGNGLRIFARFLWDEGANQTDQDVPLQISTAGGVVSAEVLNGGAIVRVEMGAVTFPGNHKPDNGKRENHKPDNRNEVQVSGHRGFLASVGNPHCVLFVDEPTAALAKSLGPEIENASWFPDRTNVQFVKVLSRGKIQMEVWERGSGYTLSSGTSAVAAVAVCRRRGLVDDKVSVMMPGGELAVEMSGCQAIIEGPVERLAEFEFPGAVF